MLTTPGLSGFTAVQVSETIDPGLIFGVTVSLANIGNIYDYDLFVECGISNTPYSPTNIQQIFVRDYISTHHPSSWSGIFYLTKASSLYLRASGNNNPPLRVYVNKISLARAEQLKGVFRA